jgi:hypothetical protein
LPVTAERGYVIPAINSGQVDFVACAEQLADSLLRYHPDANITILTKEMLPHGDLGGWANDWQCFQASPYRQTIKLEADMLATSPVDHWWTLFENRDVVISQGCRDFYNQPSESRKYRQLFDNNRLPDVYNAITYWRLSATAQEFFSRVREVFENWDRFKVLLKFPDEAPSTDVVYAMVAVIMGPERVTLPVGLGPSVTHMKQSIIPTQTSDWTKELVWEITDTGLRVQTVSQSGLFHYNIKDWRAT